MSSEAARTRLESSDAITADRYELNYLVPHGRCAELIEFFDRQLAQAPAYAVTTVYFDTESRRLLRAALGHARESIKLRAKEYFDDRSPPSSGGAAQVWLELKRRSGARTQKHRVCVSRGALERWWLDRSPLSASDYAGREADARVLEEYFMGEPEPLSPACVASYQRRAWQAEDGQLRLTLDTSLAFFVPPAELLHDRSPFREQLGEACATEASALLEVKHRTHSLPGWLGARLGELGLQATDYSKFVMAGQAVSALTDRT